MKIPGYSIEGQIGQGGMAVVYRAIQESLGRPVALKVMNPLLAVSPEFSERFLNEGRLLAALRHNHIMTIYDIGVSGDVHYISMEYVDGGDLRQQIRQGMAPLTALDYVLTLGSCLQAAHEAHIVHRDVKPVNILFRRDGTLLLTDFGIAKQLGDTRGLTVTGSMVGSPYYLSPEQALGRPIDGRADIYSLGIVLYEMLTGDKPFEGDSAVEVALKHIESALPRLPPHLSACQPLLDRMTAKNPHDRFSSAASMLQAAKHLRDTCWDDDAVAIRAPMQRLAIHEGPGVSTAVVRSKANAAGGETTVLQEEPPQPTGITRHGEAEPEALQEGSRGESTARSLVAGHMWQLTAVVVVLALAVGMIAGRLVGSRNRGMPIEAADSTPPPPAPVVEIPPEVSEPPGPRVEVAAQEPTETLEQSHLPALPVLQAGSDTQGPIDELLSAAHVALADYRLTTPAHESAYYYYQQVLAIDPHNSQAMEGFTLIAERYLALAKKALDKGQNNKARQYVNAGLQMQPAHPELLSFNDRLARPAQQSGGGDASRTVRHNRRWDEPRASGHSNGRDEPRGAENVGVAVGRFFRNVTRIFEPGKHQTTGDNAHHERRGIGSD
jgi:serine/threonine-protein kinase PpkA